MTQVTEAVYSRGVLTPSTDLKLRERQRVRLIVESLEQSPADREAALAQFRAGLAGMSFFSNGPLPSRDELHDRS